MVHLFFHNRYFDINSIKATRVFTLFLEQEDIRDFNDDDDDEVFMFLNKSLTAKTFLC